MVCAPFILHTLSSNPSTSQASGERWYLAPFRLVKIRLLWRGIPTWAMRWTYERPGQYLGAMLDTLGGTQTWRQS